MEVLGPEIVEKLSEGVGSMATLRIAYALEIWYSLHKKLDVAEWLEQRNNFLESTPMSFLLENKFNQLDSAISAELR